MAFLEPLDFGAGKRLAGELGERRAAPEVECLPQGCGRCPWRADQRVGAYSRQPFEPTEVKSLLVDLEHITGVAPLQQQGAATRMAHPDR